MIDGSTMIVAGVVIQMAVPARSLVAALRPRLRDPAMLAAIAILPVALLLHGLPPLDLTAGAWTGIVGQGLLSTMLATAAWQYGSSRVGSASAGVFINIEPLMGAVFGVALFGDRLTLLLAAGGVLILLGSLAVVLGEAPGHDAPPTAA